MADAAADHEEQVRTRFHEEQMRRRKIREEQGKKVDYKKVEFTEHEFEKWAFECKKKGGEKKRKRERKQENLDGRKKVRIVEPNSFDEMIESVDALLASLESPVAKTVIGREKAPEVFAMSEHEYASSPATAVIEIAELDAWESAIPRSNETAIPKPSTPIAETGTKPAKADVCDTATKVATCKENITTPAYPVIDITTALRSNPPSSSEQSFARNLTNAHRARMIAAMSTHELALPTFDEATGYDGNVAPAKKNKTMMTFSKAVSKGFRGIFGEEGCFS